MSFRKLAEAVGGGRLQSKIREDDPAIVLAASYPGQRRPRSSYHLWNSRDAALVGETEL